MSSTSRVPYSVDKRRGAYLIFHVSDVMLIRGRRLFLSLIPQRQKHFDSTNSFTSCVFFTQELKNAKILKGELNETASRYTHFELKTLVLMKINSRGWLKTSLHRLQCIFVILWKYSNKRLHRSCVKNSFKLCNLSLNNVICEIMEWYAKYLSIFTSLYVTPALLGALDYMISLKLTDNREC